MISDKTATLQQWATNSERGQDLSEYGLLVGFIAVLLVIAVILFGQNLLLFYNRIVADLAALLL